MSTSPSATCPPTPAPQFHQRKPSQVQAFQWPETADDSAQYHDTIGAIFNWVSDCGGIIVNRKTPLSERTKDLDAPQTRPTLVVEGDEIAIWPGDWIVRMPGYTDPDTGKPSPVNRFCVETAVDFAEDYQTQARAMRGGLDVMAQIQRTADLAVMEEGAMTPAERREASSVTMDKLGNVAGRPR